MTALGATSRRVFIALVALAACSPTAGTVLARVDAAAPPGSNPRVDVFLVRSAQTCVVGPDCSAHDTNDCFYVVDASGTHTYYAPATVRFLNPMDAALTTAQRPLCFDLGLSDAQAAQASSAAEALRQVVFRYSGGDLNLEIHTHDISSIQTDLVLFEGGILLSSTAAARFALPFVGRGSDFAFVATGISDAAIGMTVKIGNCAATIDPGKGLGGTSYSWIAVSDACLATDPFLSAWIYQFTSAIHDVMALPDLYDRNYPGCGQGGPDPTRWMPEEEDCTMDPDAPACGRPSCSDAEAYFDHIIAAHWARGTPLNGNRCRNGRMDYDEIGIDTGGSCDQLSP